MKEISAGGLVYKQEGEEIQILLIEDRYNKWTIPKGKQEAGETLAETALREIEEETGIKGQIEQPLSRVCYQYTNADGRLIDKEVQYYLVRAIGGDISPQLEEIKQTCWLELDAALEKQKRTGYANNEKLFEKAYHMLKNTELKNTGLKNPETDRPLSSYIDHTLLKPDATMNEIKELCQEAQEYEFAAVCVNPTWVRMCTQLLNGTGVKVCTVIGFPLGANTSAVKAQEARTAIQEGAVEVDMVLNIGALKDGNNALVTEDIRNVVQEAQGKAVVKVIIETSLLTEEEKIRACQLSQEAGADFVKTSTGFATGGATVDDVCLMRQTVGEHMGVKASGGIRDREKAQALIEAGATRIGASTGVSIVNG